MWFQVVQTCVMAAAAFLAALMYRSFRVGQWAASIDYGPRVQAIEARMDKAGVELSRLANNIITMPDRLRTEFMPREVQTMQFAKYQDAIDHLREDVEQIWRIVHQNE